LRGNWAYSLVVPSGAADMLDRRCAFRRLLVPLDGSAAAESALALLSLLLTQSAPDKRPRRVTLLFVASSHAQEGEGGAYLHEIQAALERETGAHGIVYTKVAVGAPPALIVEEASAAHSAIPSVARYDLTLMAIHGDTGESRWTLGGVPTYALTYGDSPLLLVRAPRTT
jgi:nucleotide-binding universal stress UspA family protein